MNTYAVAIDIGSSGGKLLAATLGDGKLQIHDEFVFNNRPIEILDSIYINPLGIYTNVLEGLTRFSRLDGRIGTIGIDSSTAMYAYLDTRGRPKYITNSSRDARMNRVLPAMEEIMSGWEQYQASGIPPFPRNMFAEIYCDILEDKKTVANMETVMGMPDILAYFLTGIKQCERTFSSVTGMATPGGTEWNYEVLKKYSIPAHLFLPIKSKHGVVGPVTGGVAKIAGCPHAMVVDVCEHDTAAAVAAIPGFTADDAFLSMGSTLILGMQCESPIITREGFAHHFKSVTMAGDKTIYMRDITGFWVLDECIKVWKNQGIDTRPGNLAGIARAAKENSSYIDVDALVFSSYSVDMPAEIQHYCKVTGQPVPGSVGEIIRCVLESCALRVRYCYKALCDIAGKKDFAKVYAVSGGIHNEILCQSLSDALQKQLIAGNPMASSAGNLLTQFLSAGIIKSLDEARRIATNTFPTRTYNPDAGKKQKWDDALFYMASHGYFDCVGSTKIERLYQYQTNKEK